MVSSLAPPLASVGSSSALFLPCEVSTTSGLSASSLSVTALFHSVHDAYGLPSCEMVTSANVQADLVEVTTFQPRSLPMVSSAEIHCSAFESPTSATVLSPSGSP